MKRILSQMKQNTYHFVYYENEGDFYSKGVDISAPSLKVAAEKFEQEYKVEPCIVHRKEIIKNHGL